MRKVIYGVAVSVDGYIAGPGGALDWLAWSDDAAKLNGEHWLGVDTVLMGRKTHEFASRQGGAGAKMNVAETYVFSRTMQGPPEGAHLVRREAARVVGDLKRVDGGKIALLGGGELAGALVEAGVVDEIQLNIHPVLLGAGTPLLARLSERVSLRLVETSILAMGCVMARYQL